MEKITKITNQTKMCTLVGLAGFCTGICEGCEFVLEEEKKNARNTDTRENKN